MARLNIFFSDQLLDEIDRRARQEGITRSALIQLAFEKYIEAKRHAREGEERRKKMQASLGWMRWRKSWETGPSGGDLRISRP